MFCRFILFVLHHQANLSNRQRSHQALSGTFQKRTITQLYNTMVVVMWCVMVWGCFNFSGPGRAVNSSWRIMSGHLFLTFSWRALEFCSWAVIHLEWPDQSPDLRPESGRRRCCGLPLKRRFCSWWPSVISFKAHMAFDPPAPHNQHLHLKSASCVDLCYFNQEDGKEGKAVLLPVAEPRRHLLKLSRRESGRTCLLGEGQERGQWKRSLNSIIKK